MPCAVFFFPRHIIEFTNFSTRVELNTASGTISRTTARLLRGILFLRLRALGPVLRPPLLAASHARRVQRSPNHVIADSRQILHAPSANQHDRVLLQVMTDPRYIGGDFDPMAQPHARHFSQRGIRLLGSLRVHARTHSALLRAAIERRAGCLPSRRFPPSTHKLVECRHVPSSSQISSIIANYPQRGFVAYGQAHVARGGARSNLGASLPAGPVFRRVVAQEQKAIQRNLLMIPEANRQTQLAGSSCSSPARHQSVRESGRLSVTNPDPGDRARGTSPAVSAAR